MSDDAMLTDVQYAIKQLSGLYNQASDSGRRALDALQRVEAELQERLKPPYDPVQAWMNCYAKPDYNADHDHSMDG